MAEVRTEKLLLLTAWLLGRQCKGSAAFATFTERHTRDLSCEIWQEKEILQMT